MTRQIDFCFDFISPYSYIAFHAAPRHLEGTNVRLAYKPVFLGAIMQATGNRPPGLVQAKAAYMQKDLQRGCARYGVSLRMNPYFPMMNTRPVLRTACALADHPEQQEMFIRTIFHHVWSAPEPLKTDEPDQVKAVCDVAGLDGTGMVELSEDVAAKAALKNNTDEAIARGAFGAPSFFVDDELFFGHDRLDYAIEAAQKLGQPAR